MTNIYLHKYIYVSDKKNILYKENKKKLSFVFNSITKWSNLKKNYIFIYISHRCVVEILIEPSVSM